MCRAGRRRRGAKRSMRTRAGSPSSPSTIRDRSRRRPAIDSPPRGSSGFVAALRWAKGRSPPQTVASTLNHFVNAVRAIAPDYHVARAARDASPLSAADSSRGISGTAWCQPGRLYALGFDLMDQRRGHRRRARGGADLPRRPDHRDPGVERAAPQEPGGARHRPRSRSDRFALRDRHRRDGDENAARIDHPLPDGTHALPRRLPPSTTACVCRGEPARRPVAVDQGRRDVSGGHLGRGAPAHARPRSATPSTCTSSATSRPPCARLGRRAPRPRQADADRPPLPAQRPARRVAQTRGRDRGSCGRTR